MNPSNPKPDPEYSEAVKQWADEMGAMSKQQPEESACVNPIEEQRKSALKHYKEASDAIHHWSGFVEAAIQSYNPTPEGKPLEVVEAAVDEAIRKYPKRTDTKPDVLKEERKAFVEGAEFVINRIAGTQWSSGGVDDAIRDIDFILDHVDGNDGKVKDIRKVVTNYFKK